jgi:hypothetical protein
MPKAKSKRAQRHSVGLRIVRAEWKAMASNPDLSEQDIYFGKYDVIRRHAAEMTKGELAPFVEEMGRLQYEFDKVRCQTWNSKAW